MDELSRVATMDRGEIEAMMNGFAPRARSAAWRPGQRVRARVSRVTGQTVFLDVGSKADAAMDRAELESDVQVGDTVEAFVSATKDGELRLTLTISGDSTREMLGEAKENGIPVHGRVTTRNEHGYEVQLSGGVRAFCPAFQIDYTIDPDLDSYVGRTLAFKVLDVRGRDAIVSHRGIAEEEARSEQGRRLTEIREGEVYEGVVIGVRDFGAFVRLPNGVEGLVHLSNIGKARINQASDALAEGQAVKVRVLGIDEARKRVSLGIRQALDGQAMAETTHDAGQLSAGNAGFGTFAGMLGGVKVSTRKPVAKVAASPAAPATSRPETRVSTELKRRRS